MFQSMKARLTALTIVLVGGVWLLAAGLTWMEAKHEAEEVFDAHLVQSASLLIAQTGLELEHDDELEDTHAPSLHRYARKVAFQVWMDGRLQLHSQNAPSTPLSDIIEGFSDRTIDGEGWRVFSGRSAQGDAVVQVGEQHASRHALAREIAAGLLRPLLIALPLLALLIWWAVGRAVAPLASAAAEIERRSPLHLDPLPTDTLPTEVRPLVERLNALFARVSQSMEQEKRFTADAAHELRTPLAGLRAQAQVAMGADGETARQKALAAVLSGCDRLQRLIEQLLLLARVDAAVSSGSASGRPHIEPSSAIDLVSVTQQALADVALSAIEREVELELIAPDHLPLQGNAAWLSMLVRNLADNAVRHAPRGSPVRVSLRTVAGGAELEVSDAGPGVPEEELARLGERFHRVLGDRAGDSSGGSGLGLSIVRRIAAAHGGTVQFARGSDGKGLCVRIRLMA